MRHKAQQQRAKAPPARPSPTPSLADVPAAHTALINTLTAAILAWTVGVPAVEQLPIKLLNSTRQPPQILLSNSVYVIVPTRAWSKAVCAHCRVALRDTLKRWPQ